jgi:ribosomal protein S24E
MEIVSRKENKLLNRVEINFRWQHEGQATPSRQAVMNLVKTLEPGSNPDCIVVKECNTRFGQPLTTGMAFIYSDSDSMTVEPEFIHKRHEQFRSTSSAPAKKEAAPAAEEAPAEEAPAEEAPAEEAPAEEGGEE